MRCQFCGWDNPQGKEICEKCNKSLTSSCAGEVGSAVDSNQDNHDRPTDRLVSGAFNPKATVREVSTAGGVNEEASNVCPKCGYKLEQGKCAVCGYGESTESSPASVKVADEARKTMRPIRKGEKEAMCRLIPISEETGLPEGDGLAFEGNEVILNRDNTDPKNATITSHEQACLACEGGKWCIEDRSEYNTTFVQAARKIELKSGDLILLGNQLYRFEL